MQGMVEDGNKLKGFSIVNGKSAIVVFKRKKEGKKTKLNVKTASKFISIQAKFDEVGKNIIQKSSKN